MNTPAHIIFGLAAFGDPDRRDVTTAAFVGALLPDASLYLLAGTHLYLLNTPPEVVFGRLYFSDAWQSIFRIDNSMILWGIALVIAMMMRSRVAIALCGAAMLHLVLDFGLHHDDGRAHFWPISDWIFQSPVSYWDPAHYGNWVGPIEIVLALAACAWKWRRYTGWRMRSLIATLGTLQLMPVIMFTLMFS